MARTIDRGPSQDASGLPARRWAWAILAALVGLALLISAHSRRMPAAAHSPHCDLFASPSGLDSSGDGSSARPFASVRRLDSALAPGQTGCLRAGTYGDTSTWERIAADGLPAGRITITSSPGQTATIVGWVDVEASYTTVENLRIDGSNTLYASHPSGVNCADDVSQPLTIGGHDDILQDVDYFQSISSLRGNGIGIGFGGDGEGDNTIVRYNKIHDVGSCKDYDHIIYLSHGNDVQIYDNWMWNDSHGWGVQLYPAPTNAHVYNNVIDAAGSGFVIGGGPGVAGNMIDNNVIINSTGLVKAGLFQGVGIVECCGLGSGNIFRSNDVFNDPGGIGLLRHVQAYDNLNTDPQFIDAANHDYQVQPGSPIAGWGLWNGDLAITRSMP
jgi:hypothetical protein